MPSVPLFVPVMMICATVTEPEVNDGAYSTVAKQEIIGCTPACNPNAKDCQVPPAFEAMVRRAVVQAIGPKRPEVAPPAKAKKPTKRKRR